MKILIPVSVRPNFPKVAPVIRVLKEKGAEVIIAHTRLHWDESMSDAFFRDLKIPPPDHVFEWPLEQYQNPDGLFEWLIDILSKEQPDILYVHGDTAMVPPSILAGKTLKIITVHEEAGLRAKSVVTLEERNRRLADHLADYLIAPSQLAVENLIRERLSSEKILLAGNPIIDAIRYALIHKPSEIVKRAQNSRYVLVSVHRPENLDKPTRIRRLLTELEGIAHDMKVKIYLARHPRFIRILQKMSIKVYPPLEILPWLAFIDFIHFLKGACVLITDSGTSQEEACETRTPIITLLSQTDRLETVEIGANLLKPDLTGLAAIASKQCTHQMDWHSNPYGDGSASHKIADWLLAGFQLMNYDKGIA